LRNPKEPYRDGRLESFSQTVRKSVRNSQESPSGSGVRDEVKNGVGGVRDKVENVLEVGDGLDGVRIVLEVRGSQESGMEARNHQESPREGGGVRDEVKNGVGGVRDEEKNVLEVGDGRDGVMSI
jgi:hypothetical protein